MDQNTMIKLKTFLISVCLIAFIALCILGILMILLGSYGEFEMKLVASSFVITGYSVMGIVLSSMRENESLKQIQKVGLGLGSVGVFLSLLVIWNILWLQTLPLDILARGLLFFLVSTILCGYMHLLSFLPDLKGKVQSLKTVSKISLFLMYLQVLFIIIIPISVDVGELYFKLMGLVGLVIIASTCGSFFLSRKVGNAGR